MPVRSRNFPMKCKPATRLANFADEAESKTFHDFDQTFGDIRTIGEFRFDFFSSFGDPTEHGTFIRDAVRMADRSAISGGVSADGRYVTFLSAATNLVATDSNAATDAFVRDTCTGVASGCTPSTQLVSVTTAGTQANGPTTSATIDATGRYITFESEATNLGSSSSSGGIFLRDTCSGVTSGCTPSTQPLN